MEHAIITLKPVSADGETEFRTVDPKKAEEIARKVDRKDNFYLGSEYFSWTRVMEIAMPPKDKRLEAVKAKGCGACEKGWMIGPGGAFPCGCRLDLVDKFRDYQQHVSQQDWYNK